MIPRDNNQSCKRPVVWLSCLVLSKQVDALYVSISIFHYFSVPTSNPFLSHLFSYLSFSCFSLLLALVFTTPWGSSLVCEWSFNGLFHPLILNWFLLSFNPLLTKQQLQSLHSPWGWEDRHPLLRLNNQPLGIMKYHWKIYPSFSKEEYSPIVLTSRS